MVLRASPAARACTRLGRRHRQHHAGLQAVHVVADEGAAGWRGTARPASGRARRPARCVLRGDLRERVARLDPVLVGTGAAGRGAAACRPALRRRVLGAGLVGGSGAGGFATSRARLTAPRGRLRALRGPTSARAVRRQRRGRGGAADMTGEVVVRRAPASAQRRGWRPADRTAACIRGPAGRSPTRSRGSRRRTAPARRDRCTRRTNRRPSARFCERGAACSAAPGCSRRWRRDRSRAARRGCAGCASLRRHAGDFDLGPQRFAERRLHGEPAEAQRGSERRDARQRAAAATLVSAKRPENVRFSFQGVSRMRRYRPRSRARRSSATALHAMYATAGRAKRKRP